MGGILESFLILACSFWITAQVIGGVQIQEFNGSVLAAVLFGTVNALLGWFLISAVTIVPIDVAFLVLFGTRWVVNALLLVLLHTSTKVLILRNVGIAFSAGLMITAMGTLAEYFLRLL
jgi:putative membrane protein